MNKLDRGQVIGSAAEVYDQFFLPALFTEWAPRMVAAARIKTGQSVLDVACGTGALTTAAAAQAGPTGTVIGLDINPEMLAVARKKDAAIEWRQGRAEKLLFPAGTFDAVVSQFGLMFFEDRSAAIGEMVRVLRPGGRLAVAVWDSLENTPGYAVVTRLLERLFGSHAADALRAPFVLGDTGPLKEMFLDRGLSGVEIRTLKGTARFPSLSSWMYTDVKGWTLADVLDDAQFERLQQEAERALQEFVREDGAVRFPAPAHIVTGDKA